MPPFPRPTQQDAEGSPAVAQRGPFPLPRPPGGGGWCRGAELCLGGSLAPPGTSVGSEDQVPELGVPRC